MEGDEKNTPKPYRSIYIRLNEREKPPRCQDLVTETFKTNCWLFDPKTKQWYTPEQFLSKFDKIEEVLRRVEIKDPVEAIKEAKEKIQQQHNKLDSFTERVIEYYKNKQSRMFLSLMK